MSVPSSTCNRLNTTLRKRRSYDDGEHLFSLSNSQYFLKISKELNSKLNASNLNESINFLLKNVLLNYPVYYLFHILILSIIFQILIHSNKIDHELEIPLKRHFDFLKSIHKFKVRFTFTTLKLTIPSQ